MTEDMVGGAVTHADSIGMTAHRFSQFALRRYLITIAAEIEAAMNKIGDLESHVGEAQKDERPTLLTPSPNSLLAGFVRDTRERNAEGLLESLAYLRDDLERASDQVYAMTERISPFSGEPDAPNYVTWEMLVVDRIAAELEQNSREQVDNGE